MSRSIRRYGTFAQIRDMIARTALTELRYSVVELLETLFGILFTFVLPVLMTFSPDSRTWPFAIAAWILMSVSLLPTLIFYRVSPLFAPLLPFAAIFYAYATGLSAVRYWLEHGAQRKERSQAPARRDAHSHAVSNHAILAAKPVADGSQGHLPLPISYTDPNAV